MNNINIILYYTLKLHILKYYFSLLIFNNILNNSKKFEKIIKCFWYKYLKWVLDVINDNYISSFGLNILKHIFK